MRHCGVLLSTVSHTSGLSDRSPIDPDCGWLCSDKCWLGGSGRMRGGGRRGARRWGALLLSCRPQALQRIGLWLKFMGDRSDVGREMLMAKKCALRCCTQAFILFPPSGTVNLEFGLQQTKGT